MFSNMIEADMRDRVNFCLGRVNLEGANKKYPAELSGGMKKRVAIARAIAMNPKYLFCDEPNSGLDPQTSIVIDNLIREITLEFGITTVINTHDMNSVMEIGDNVILIKDGYKAWQGNKADILTTDNENVNEFVFTSQLLRRVKELHLQSSRRE
jgi:phospholipid/cholesterol/gamma-HCH transport system ATP-binding protein